MPIRSLILGINKHKFFVFSLNFILETDFSGVSKICRKMLVVRYLTKLFLFVALVFVFLKEFVRKA